MSTPLIVPETFANGPEGNTPLDATAMNNIWAALMQALLDQLVARKTAVDASVNPGDMIIADASNGAVHLQAPPASVRGNWGVRKDDLSPNPVIITAQGTDQLDDDGATIYTIVSPGDDVVFSYAGPGHFSLVRRNAATRPATATTFGTLRFGPTSDLVGPAEAITVPGKENVGVAATLIGQHSQAPDPHGDRAWSQQNAGQQVGAHAGAGDPHGDRAWALNNLVPRSWFDAQGQLLPSHTGSLSIINTFVVNSQAAMLALAVQTGDIAIRTDAASSGGQRSYILQGSDPTQLASWTVMPAIGAVSSVRGSANSTGLTGDVVLGYADVGAASTTDPRIVGAQQTSQKNVANGYAGLTANATVSVGNLPTASPTGYGVLMLTGDLGGTAANPTVPGKMPLVTPNTTVYTAATNPHTPLQGEIAQYNANAASINQNLPPAPTSVSTVTVLELKNLTPVGSANTVTFTPVGTDTIDGTTSPLVMRGYGESRRLIGYMGNWLPDMGLNTYSALDARYLQIANALQVPAVGTTGYVLTKTGAASTAYGWTSIAGSVAVENTNYQTTVGTTYVLPDVTVATIHDLILTANTAFTFPAPGAGKSFTLVLNQDATGGRVPTWPAGLMWPSATAPTLTTTAGRTDILTFVSRQTGASTWAWVGMLSAKDVR